MEIEELEHCLLGQEGQRSTSACSMNAKGKKRRRLLQILSAQGQSGFLVVSAARWDKFSLVQARQEEEYQELSNVTKHMSERQGKLLAMMERTKNLLREAPEDLRTQIFQVIRDLDERGKECRGGARENYSYCWKWCHSEGNSWVSKHRNRGYSPFGAMLGPAHVRGGLRALPNRGCCDGRRSSSSYDQLVEAVLQCKAAGTR